MVRDHSPYLLDTESFMWYTYSGRNYIYIDNKHWNIIKRSDTIEV